MNSEHALCRIELNGQAHATTASTVLLLLEEITGQALQADGSSAQGGRLGVAVAVDGTVVPRSRWHEHPVQAGQRIEVVTAKQGG